MKDWFVRMIKWGTYAVVFLTPILYFGGSFFIPYSTSKTFVFYGLVEVVFFLWLYVIYTDNSFRLSKKSLLFFLPLFLFLGWLTVAGVLGVRPEMSFWSSLMRGTGLITLYHCLGLSLVLVSLIKRDESFVYFKKLLFWFLGGSAVLVLSIWLGDEGFNLPLKFLEKSKGGGLMGNSSLAASYLIFSLFFSFFLFSFKESNRQQKIWLSLFILLTILSPLFLNVLGLFYGEGLLISARGAVLGIIVGILGSFCGFLFFSKQRLIKNIGLAGLIVGLAIFVFGSISLLTPESFIQKSFVKSATGSRLIFWNIAEKGIAERPILGWGGENYSVVYQKYFDNAIFSQSTSSVEVWNDRAHNVLFETGVASGYPAIVLYILFLLSLVYGIYRAFSLERINRIQGSIFLGLIVGYFVQNLFVFDSLSSLLALFVFVAIIFGLNEDLSIKQQQKDSWIVGAVLIVFLCASFNYFVIKPIFKVTKISEVVTLSLNKRPEHYKDLLNISPVGDGFEIGSIANDAYILYSGNLKNIKNDPKLLAYSKIDLERLLEYLEQITLKEPLDYRLNLNLARLYLLYADMVGKKDDPVLVKRISEISLHLKQIFPNDSEVRLLIR